MATQRPSNEEYGDIYDNPQSRFNTPTTTGTWGVQNAIVERGSKNQRQSADNRRMAARQNASFDSEETFSQQRTGQRIYAPEAAARQKLIGAQNTSQASLAKGKTVKMRAQLLRWWILSWTTFWWASIQVWASITALLLLGAAFEVSNSWVLDVLSGALKLATELLGLPTVDIMTLFFIAAGVSFFISLMNFGVSWIIYTLAGIHSVNGTTGAGLKHATIIATLIGGLPGLSLIPWIWLWIWAVTKYPQ